MFNSNAMPYSMPVTPMVTSGGNGFFDGNGGIWFLIILFILGGWGNGGWGGNSGANRDYVLTSDFAQLSKQISDQTLLNDRKFDSITNGICNLGYTQQTLMNQNATSMMQGFNAVQSQMADCCCKTQTNIGDVKYTIGATGSDISRGVERGFADTNYNVSTLANGIQNSISNGFCQTNFNNSNNTRDIITSTHTDTDRIIARLDAIESNRQAEKIADLQAENQNLKFTASQVAQNQYLVNQLRPCPSPAYVVPNPYCNCNCNNNLYGTTIA